MCLCYFWLWFWLWPSPYFLLALSFMIYRKCNTSTGFSSLFISLLKHNFVGFRRYELFFYGLFLFIVSVIGVCGWHLRFSSFWRIIAAKLIVISKLINFAKCQFFARFSEEDPKFIVFLSRSCRFDIFSDEMSNLNHSICTHHGWRTCVRREEMRISRE